jgi:predicted ATPase
MRLRDIVIKDYRAIKDLELRFTDRLGRVRPITVIAGPNGSGKTSLLFGIVQALRGPMGYVTDDVPDPSDQEIHRVRGETELTLEPPHASVKFEVEFDEVERDAIPEVFEDTRGIRGESERLSELTTGRVRGEWAYPPESWPDGRPKPTWYLRWTEPRDALPWFRGFRYAIRGWNARRLRSRALLERVGGLFLFPQDRGLKSRILGEENNAVLGWEDSDANDETGGEHRRDRRTSPSIYGVLKYLSEYARAQKLESDEQAEFWEDRVKESFRRVCQPKEYLGFMYHRDSPVGAPYFKDGNSVYPLQMASSGEQVIMEYVTRLSYPSPVNHSLILIDEPELHLHPGWIRQLYRALPCIGEGNQYVMTTHSQELRRMAAEDNALITLGPLGDEVA